MGLGAALVRGAALIRSAALIRGFTFPSVFEKFLTIWENFKKSPEIDVNGKYATKRQM